MKTKYKYIYFERAPVGISGWACWNKRGLLLGAVRYIGKWKEWEFQPKPDMGFTIECLNDIAHFISQLNKEPNP